MSQTILITGASTGFGRLAAREVARNGHTDFAGMYVHDGNTNPYGDEIVQFARESDAELRSVALNLPSDDSVDAVVKHVMVSVRRIAVVVHNAGHKGFGPAESLTPLQFTSIDTVAAKAAMDPLAQTYAKGLPYSQVPRGHPWGVETTTLSLGVFTTGTNHFTDTAKPGLPHMAQEDEDEPRQGLSEQTMTGTAGVVPEDADSIAVAAGLVKLAAIPRRQKPLRMFADPAGDGADVVASVLDRMGEDFYRRLGLEKYLKV